MFTDKNSTEPIEPNEQPDKCIQMEKEAGVSEKLLENELIVNEDKEILDDNKMRGTEYESDQSVNHTNLKKQVICEEEIRIIKDEQKRKNYGRKQDFLCSNQPYDAYDVSTEFAEGFGLHWKTWRQLPSTGSKSLTSELLSQMTSK